MNPLIFIPLLGTIIGTIIGARIHKNYKRREGNSKNEEYTHLTFIVPCGGSCKRAE